MIFDFTDLTTGVNTRFKPRNHFSVEGHLLHGNDIVASLRSCALLYTENYKAAGGRFQLAWHKMRGPINEPLRLIITTTDDRAPENAIGLAYGSGKWVVDDLCIMQDGTPLAIGHFSELLGRDVPFFGTRAV
jgi:hypothetical protein